MSNCRDEWKADAQAFGQQMHSINQAQVVAAAARDYQEEMLANQKQSRVVHQTNMHEVMDDPELQKLHEQRIEQLKSAQEKRAEMARKGHGEMQEIEEGEFLEVVTKTEMVVCHFFHREFERCKIMDKHLNSLARKHFKTRFIKVSAPDSPFFTVKLDIQMLPCVVCFVNGVSVHRVVGFEGLGGLDDFPTDNLEDVLLECGALEPLPPPLKEPERMDGPSMKVRKGFCATASDEDSDFDD